MVEERRDKEEGKIYTSSLRLSKLSNTLSQSHSHLLMRHALAG